MNSNDLRANKANHVTWVGFYINLVIVVFKMFAGIVGHSSAMIADAVHSLSDFATDVVVLISFRVIRKPIDKEHDYGHGKFETLATAIIGIALFLVGTGILWGGLRKTWWSLQGIDLGKPRIIAFIAAIVSVVVKEWMYRYTVKVGREINSSALIANAWHHRSDAFSSIGTMFGIGGAIVLGAKWRVLDPIAAVVVSIFIMKVAVEISKDSIKELMEESLEETVEEEILTIVKNIQGIVEPHDLKTRRIGNTIAVELHIHVNKDITVFDAHEIASKAEADIRDRFGQDAFISIHIEPNLKTDAT